MGKHHVQYSVFLCWTYTAGSTPKVMWYQNIEYDEERKEQDEAMKNGKKQKPHLDREYKIEDESGEKY